MKVYFYVISSFNVGQKGMGVWILNFYFVLFILFLF